MLDRDELHLVGTPEELCAFISKEAEVASKTMELFNENGTTENVQHILVFETVCVCLCMHARVHVSLHKHWM